MPNNLGSLGEAFVDFRVNLTDLISGLRKAEDETNKSTKNISGSISDIGAATKGLAKRVAGISAAFVAFGAIAAGAVTVGLARLTKQSLDLAEALGDMAKRASVSAEFLQELQFAGRDVDVSASEVGGALVTLRERIEEFATTGGGEGADAFRALGIASQITAGTLTNTEDVFRAITGTIGNIKDPLEQSRIGAELLGDEAGRNLVDLLRKGQGAIDDYAMEARNLGAVLSNEAVDGAVDANQAIEKLGNVLRNNFTSALISAAPQIEEVAKLLTDSLPVLLDWVGAFAEFVAPAGFRDAADELDKLDKKIQELNDTGINPFVREGRKNFGVNRFQDEIDLLKQRRAVLLDIIAAEQLDAAIADSKKKPPKPKDDDKPEPPKPPKPPTDLTPDFSGGVGEDNLGVGNIEVLLTDFERLVQEISNAQPTIDQFGNSVGDAFTEFALGTGRAADVFRSFAASVISDIARIIARQLVLNAITGIFGGAPSGSSGLFSSVFGGFRADGGPVQANKAFIVGERGPELFVPNQNGGIVPNEMLGGGLEQRASVMNTFNINGEVTRDIQQLRSVVEASNRNFGSNVREVVNQSRRTGGIG